MTSDTAKKLKSNLLKKKGVCGASYNCIETFVSTKELNCSVDEYRKTWDEVVRSVKVKGFDLYEN